MAAVVPSLEATLYLTDPESIIAYTLRKCLRTVNDTVPITPDSIISFPWLIANFVNQPDHLCNAMSSSLQKTLQTIFGTDRSVTASASHTPDPLDPAQYSITMTIIYTLDSGEVTSTGMRISVNSSTGRLVIPEDTIKSSFLSNFK